MRGGRSQRGEPSTTKSVRTAAWDTKLRKSLLLLRPQPSTALSEGQETQTPSLAPRAPPSRLKPESEQQKGVVFLRERKQGAGQTHLSLKLQRQEEHANRGPPIRSETSAHCPFKLRSCVFGFRFQEPALRLCVRSIAQKARAEIAPQSTSNGTESSHAGVLAGCPVKKYSVPVSANATLTTSPTRAPPIA